MALIVLPEERLFGGGSRIVFSTDRQISVTLTDKLRFPPCLARIMAVKDGQLMSDQDLARLTGWGERKLRRVYNSSTWLDITDREKFIFFKACGMSPFSLRRQRWLIHLAIKRGGLHTMQHLKQNKNSTGWKGNQLKLHLERIEKLLGEI